MDPVLIVSPWYKGSIGGVARIAGQLLHGLSKAGVKSYLIVTCEEKPTSQDIESNVWYFQIPSYAFYRLNPKAIVMMFLRGAIAFGRLFSFIRKHDIHTVIIPFPRADVWAFVLLRYICRLRLITSCEGNDITRFKSHSVLHQWIIRRGLKSSDVVLVCAEHLGTKAIQITGNPSLPVHHIPNCADVNYFVPAPPHSSRSNGKTTLVHVSTFVPKKRTLDIIEGFALAQIPADTRLVMVGAGQELEATIERSRALGLGNRVEFVGRQQDVRPYLWDADIFVLASDDEGAPLALVEAMACGLPWISTPWGPAADLPNGECGLVVPIGSIRHLAEAITQLVNDSAQRRSAMGARGRYYAEREFGETEYIRRHLEVIFPTATASTAVSPGHQMIGLRCWLL